MRFNVVILQFAFGNILVPLSNHMLNKRQLLDAFTLFPAFEVGKRWIGRKYESLRHFTMLLSRCWVLLAPSNYYNISNDTGAYGCWIVSYGDEDWALFFLPITLVMFVHRYLQSNSINSLPERIFINLRNLNLFSHLCERLKRVQFIPVFLLVAVSKRLNGGQFLTDHVYYDCKQRYWLITKLCRLFSISNI